MRPLTLFTLGAVLVATAEPTPAQDAPKERELKAPYDEWVQFRYRAADPKFEFVRAVKAAAYRKEADGKVRFFLETRASSGANPTPGSQIVDKDEVVWVVAKSTVALPNYICDVVKQPPVKKKATRKG